MYIKSRYQKDYNVYKMEMVALSFYLRETYKTYTARLVLYVLLWF